MKDIFVRSIDNRNKAIGHQNRMHAGLSSLWREHEGLLGRSCKMGTVLEEKKRTFDAVLKFRAEFRETKKTLEKFRHDLIHIIDKLMVGGRRSEGYAGLGRELQKIKAEIKKIDEILDPLSKSSTQLDIALSKVELVAKEYEVPIFRRRALFLGVSKKPWNLKWRN